MPKFSSAKSGAYMASYVALPTLVLLALSQTLPSREAFLVKIQLPGSRESTVGRALAQNVANPSPIPSTT